MDNGVRLLRLLFLFLAIIGGGSVWVGTSHAVELAYKPAVGSRWISTLEMRETKTKGGQTVESTIVREKGEYRILRKLEKGYHISYTLKDGSIEGDTALAKLMTPLLKSLKGQSYTFETNEEGVPVRMPDVAKVTAIAIKAIDIVAQSKPEFSSVPQLKQFIAGLRSQYNAATPETGVQLFLSDMVFFTLVQGLPDVPVGEEQTYDDQVVNPMTGTIMSAKGSVKIASVDQSAGMATIEWKQTISPEDLRKATMEVVQKLVPNATQGSKEFAEILAQVKIDHLDKATYKIALADGVARRMDKTTVVKTQAGEKKKLVTMTMKPAK